MHPLAKLAKSTVEHYIKKKEIIAPAKDLPEDFLKKRSGIFVTIKNKEKLRACIGTYLPTKINIAEETIHNAVAAASKDDRFERIEKEELPHLSYIVHVLGSPELVEDIETLNPKKFGIIVKTHPFAFPNEENVVFDNAHNHKVGLLLPDLEGIDTPEEQLSIACQKAEISPEKENLFIYRFTAEKHE